MNGILFKEASEYDRKVKAIKEFRKTCYLFVLFFMMDDPEQVFKTMFESDIEAVLKCDEENFYNYEFDRLTDLFPNSKKFFIKNKFMGE